MGLPAHTDPHKKLHAFAWSFFYVDMTQFLIHE